MQSLMRAATAGLVFVAAASNASAQNEASAKDSAVGMAATFASACQILSGQCDGTSQGVAVRFGNSTERREWVVSAATFNEATRGGVDRAWDITHRGDKLGAVDFWLHGGLSVYGKTLAVDKFFPLGERGVLQVGGYVGKITGRAEAEIGAALTVAHPALHYAASKGWATEQSAHFGGVRQAVGVYVPLTPHVALVTQQYLAAGMDKGRAGLSIGAAYFAAPSDRTAMRPDGCGAQMSAAKGLVMALQLCASEILYDKLGQKLDGKFTGLANRVNGHTARAEQYGQTIPAITGAPFARLMGYELPPKREQAVSFSVAMPLGKAAHLTAAVRRDSAQTTSRTAALTYQF